MVLIQEIKELELKKFEWKKILAENLDLSYTSIFSKRIGDEIFKEFENSIEYYLGDLTKVKIFGKCHEIPRQQVAYGDPNMVYKFSGLSLPAKPWSPILLSIRDLVLKLTGISYNFVLINRYKDGFDHIGEHRDGERELDPNSPIASISLGQHRDFVLKHGDNRKKGKEKRSVPLVKLELEHGSLLLMNPPSNKYWYHSIPPRRNSTGSRINLTFRRLLT